MLNWMQGWMEQFEKLLEERSGAALTVTPELTEPRPAALFLSTITLDGPMRGLLRIAVPDAEMVQFAQLAGRRPLDAQVALDESILAEWKSLLEESATRLTAQLLAEGKGEYTAVLREMRATDTAADANDPANADPNADPKNDSALAAEISDGSASGPASGMEEASYVLRAGEIALRISVQTRMEPAAQDTATAEMPESALDAGQVASDVAAQDMATQDMATQDMAVPVAEAAGFAARQAADVRAAEARAAEARAAEESMNRAEARAARRRAESPVEESILFRAHPERLDLLLDIELEATLRFGAVEMPLRKVLELGPGDVLQLDRHVQEPVDLVVGDRIVARGEVVLVGGNFGLHVTEVAEPRRRLETIRCLF